MMIPVQVISDHPDVAFIKHDLQQLGVAEQDLKSEALFTELVARKITYDRPALFQCHLIARSAKRHELIISLPVACADAASLDCLVRQIAAAYTAASRPENPWTTEAMQYADFAEWQNELLETEARLASHYWNEENLTETDIQKLFCEKHISSMQPFQPLTMPFEISAAVGDRIKAIANRYQAPRSTFALACWQILLLRVSDSSNIVTGIALDGRKFAELEEAIGLFSTFVPLRTRLSIDHSFAELLQQTS